VVPTTTKGFTTNTGLVVFTIFDTFANNSRHHLQSTQDIDNSGNLGW
jgi:hypothetical protein